MKIRKSEINDFNAIADLIRSAIVLLNSADYSQEQIVIWSSKFNDADKLQLQSKEHDFYLCVNEEDKIMGIFSLNKFGFIHYFFVHPAHTQKGVAHYMYEELMKYNVAKKIEVHASKTILPFFLKRGFEIVKEQSPEIDGVKFCNYHLEKSMHA